ncbi:hypothetical protein [Novosphingobium olei]|uniref:hypothetical protein n=1 Tax=Novosphingobium olei TaxID=2728851 RepID=UPI003088FBFB|nr:hypothetical protein NSDW_11630 [Novosphingobium olei]
MGDFLKVIGSLGILVGGFFLDNAMLSGITNLSGSVETINLDLMAARADTIGLGSALFVSGWLCVIASYLGEKLDKIAARLRQEPNDAPPVNPTDY